MKKLKFFLYLFAFGSAVFLIGITQHSLRDSGVVSPNGLVVSNAQLASIKEGNLYGINLAVYFGYPIAVKETTLPAGAVRRGQVVSRQPLPKTLWGEQSFKLHYSLEIRFDDSTSATLRINQEAERFYVSYPPNTTVDSLYQQVDPLQPLTVTFSGRKKYVFYVLGLPGREAEDADFMK